MAWTNKIPPNETERRRREERLNQIRMSLIAKYPVPDNTPQIIVSRACKYKGDVGGKLSLTTLEIENVLTSQHMVSFNNRTYRIARNFRGA